MDLIVAKALNKNMEERYQSARDLAKDLQDCKKMLQGRAAGSRKLRRGATRRAARTDRHAAPGQGPADQVREHEGGGRAPASKPALTLAKGFDSYEATMRLAAMTGMDKELTGFDSDADTEGDVASSHAHRFDRLSGPPIPRAARRKGSGGSYAWLWIVSIVVALIAVALFVWR